MKINRSILPPGRIGLAVSGGSDSVALAFLLTKGGKKKNAAKRFVVLHVDHGLRKESKCEYKFVRDLAKRLGVPFKGHHAKVVKRAGESIEMAARRVRLAFFSKCMETLKLDVKRKINTFSKGMRKQLSVMLGVSAGTKYLLCDETFDGLDPVIRQAVKSLFISEMAERYSKMDFDEVDEFNRRISSLILEGKLTEADSLLNTKGDINSRTDILRQHQKANAPHSPPRLPLLRRDAACQKGNVRLHADEI